MSREKNAFSTTDHLAWVKGHREDFIAPMTCVSSSIRARFKNALSSLFYFH